MDSQRWDLKLLSEENGTIYKSNHIETTLGHFDCRWRKTIETRTHDRFKNLVGRRVAIYAGKTLGLVPLEVLRWPHASRIFDEYKVNELPKGAVVCTVFVKESRLLTNADSFSVRISAEGKCGLILNDIRKFKKPIPARGHQGIWEWSSEKEIVN